MSVLHEFIRPALDVGQAFIPHCVREKDACPTSQAGPQNSRSTLSQPLSHAGELFFSLREHKSVLF